MLSQRTEAAQVYANPDGSFTQDTYALPQFVRQRQKLVPINTSLKANPDGTFSPQAIEIGVAFSGGGDGPMVTVARDGREMSWSWPKPLPKPLVENDTVTYPSVLPGVDLKLRAGTAGFSQLLVVKSAKAAANPALRKISFDLKTRGVSLKNDEHGNLSARNPAGQEIFTASAPLMWDSTSKPMVSGRAGGPPPPATEFEAPHGAKESPVGVDVRDGKLSLTPDQKILTGRDTTYPVYIDPDVKGSRYAWTIAYKKYPNTSYYNGQGFDENDGDNYTTKARAGFENKTDGLARSYFRMRTANLWSTDKIISSSTFRIKNIWSWSCASRQIELWRTATMGSGTTWNNQPTKRETLDTVNDSKGWGSTCPAGNLAFNTTAAAKDAAASHWNTITLALKATNESDVYAWKKFDAKSAVLTTRYNTRPSVPSGLDTSPVSTRNESGCGDVAPRGVIGNTDFYLNAKVSDRDGGTVKARFHLWPTSHNPNDDPNGVLIINQTISVTSGTVARVKVPKNTLLEHLGTANGNFSWKAQADDGSAKSDWNPTYGAPGCRFIFDPNRPSTQPDVESPQFPDGSEGQPSNTGRVRTAGTFTFSAAGVPDVVAYEWWTDSSPTRHRAEAPSPGASASVKITPTWAGPSHMYVKSIDAGGNKSDPRSYLFYVDGLSTPDSPGDVNGDGRADLWAIASDDKLYKHWGSGTGTVGAAVQSSNETWADVKITHRGDWTGDGYEDLIALRHDTASGLDRLWVHPNNGYGWACTGCPSGAYQRNELTTLEPENNHWKNGAKQILAIGDVDGPTDTDGDGTPDADGHPDLIVNDGASLWLYYGDRSGYLDAVREPVLLASGDSMSSGGGTLSMVSLAAPGDFTGDGNVDLLARFDHSGSGLFLYDSINPDGPNGPGQTTPSHRIALVGGWGPDSVPLFTAAPDANSDGRFDLWTSSVNNPGRLRFWADFTTSGYTAVTVASEDFTGYKSLG